MESQCFDQMTHMKQKESHPPSGHYPSLQLFNFQNKIFFLTLGWALKKCLFVYRALMVDYNVSYVKWTFHGYLSCGIHHCNQSLLFLYQFTHSPVRGQLNSKRDIRNLLQDSQHALGVYQSFNSICVFFSLESWRFSMQQNFHQTMLSREGLTLCRKARLKKKTALPGF